ncbi:protein FAM237A-like [Protopterus annectens]|uniref:protein FAM237A-like n=1 Tax=Protopterus annectens TaxID=7888 RepID=UPI001CFAD5AC|nr:protein FAM237A-like [Protopterus annectens]
MKVPDKHKHRYHLLPFTVLLLLLTCALRLGNPTGVSEVFSQLSEKEIYDPQCFDMASLALVRTKKIKFVTSVSELWDFMIFLNKFENPRYSALFWDLSEIFYHLYVKCMQARTHGLGRRAITTKKNTNSFTNKSLKRNTVNKKEILDKKPTKIRQVKHENLTVLNRSNSQPHHQAL